MRVICTYKFAPEISILRPVREVLTIYDATEPPPTIVPCTALNASALEPCMHFNDAFGYLRIEYKNDHEPQVEWGHERTWSGRVGGQGCNTVLPDTASLLRTAQLSRVCRWGKLQQLNFSNYTTSNVSPRHNGNN